MNLSYFLLYAAKIEENPAKHIFHSLPSLKPKTMLHIALEVIEEPMFILPQMH